MREKKIMAKITEIKLTPSAELAEIIGSKPITRPQATKKIWAYIKENGLQDEENKRMINADEKLRVLFGKDQISMFELAKIMGKHLG